MAGDFCEQASAIPSPEESLRGELNIQNRSATLRDLQPLVALHRLSLEVGLLAQAPKFVLIDFYRRLVNSPNSVTLLSVCSSGEIVGFCSVVMNHLSRQIFGSPLVFLGSLLTVILRPQYVGVLIHNLRQFIEMPSQPSLEIVAVSVAPEQRGRGIGEKLIRDALTMASFENPVKVVTKTHNPRLAQFYVRNFDAEILSYKDLGPYEEFSLRFRHCGKDK